MIIDTHAHLMFDKFEGEVDQVVERAKEVGVGKIINIGCTLKDAIRSHEMSLKYDELYATLGLHPHDALDISDELMVKWAGLIEENKRIVAIGECGLDYVKADVPKEDQKKAFRMQLKLAQKVGLPVIIHNRDADEDTMEILDEFDVNAVFHCYSSDIEFARKLWYKGYFTSFTGVVTYPNTEDLLKVVEEAPMDKFMVETDCPFLAPQGHRGERNEPSYVAEVVEKIAEIKRSSPEEIARISTENAEGLFFRLNR
ncbi:MAG: TatD family hydrolase [Nitrospirota bacterium]